MSRDWADEDLWRPAPHPWREALFMVAALVTIVVAILVGLSIGQADRVHSSIPTVHVR